MCDACVLCRESGGRVVFSASQFRLIHAQEPGLEAFYRLIWNAHVAEWSDLSAEDQVLCMQAVTQVEQAMREVLAPRKINLAALGNMVPHLHWHVIARFEWDGYFPAPVWAQPHTPPEQLPVAQVDRVRRLRGDLEAAMVARLQSL
ncbi:HIT family protein [Lampropedia puyangensis]|uniref:HIT family protein n=1 Tax=Lampropedia puyangensis TaxID=1330072 RepID=A0A4S8F5Q1_9BURK|nr:HIT family protein [Lampropedia puyangensis]THU02773.1 HIT family protein [Lampropedia puyangensis]